MTEEHLEAVRQLRVEADNLRTACTAETGVSSLLHVAFDREAAPMPRRSDLRLIRELRAIP